MAQRTRASPPGRTSQPITSQPSSRKRVAHACTDAAAGAGDERRARRPSRSGEGSCESSSTCVPGRCRVASAHGNVPIGPRDDLKTRCRPVSRAAHDRRRALRGPRGRRRSSTSPRTQACPRRRSRACSTTHRSCSVSTRDRVLAAVAELGFQINHAARSLRTSRTGLIGFLVPVISIFGLIVEALDAQLALDGFSILLTSSRRRAPERDRESIEVLVGRGVDALVLAPSNDQQPGSRRVPRDASARRSCCSIASCPASPPDKLLVDHAPGIRRALESLLASGGTRIGVLTRDRQTRAGRAIIEAWAKETARLGARSGPGLVAAFDDLDRRGRPRRRRPAARRRRRRDRLDRNDGAHRERARPARRALGARARTTSRSWPTATSCRRCASTSACRRSRIRWRRSPRRSVSSCCDASTSPRRRPARPRSLRSSSIPPATSRGARSSMSSSAIADRRGHPHRDARGQRGRLRRLGRHRPRARHRRARPRRHRRGGRRPPSCPGVRGAADLHVWSRSPRALLIGADPFELAALYDRLYQATLVPRPPRPRHPRAVGGRHRAARPRGQAARPAASTSCSAARAASRSAPTRRSSRAAARAARSAS